MLPTKCVVRGAVNSYSCKVKKNPLESSTVTTKRGTFKQDG